MAEVQKTFSSLGQENCRGNEDLRHGSIEETSLDLLGLSSPMEKNMTALEIISASWIICVSFVAVAATLSLTISNGGPPTLLYGIVVVFIFMGASAASLAELASIYPTAGGQYHWTSILAPKKWRRGLSYICGVTNIFAWISLCSGFAAVISQLLIAIVIFYHDDYTPKPWHYFIVFTGVTLLVLLYDMFLLKRSQWINTFAFCFTLSAFLVILITCAARAKTHQSSATVWTIFVNDSGWSSDGVVFFIGLISPNYMYSGLDGAIHLAEDCKNASTAVPRALICTVVLGFLTTFPFIIVLLYSTSDLDAVLMTPTGVPVYEIFKQACRSDGAATAFIICFLMAGVFALVGAQQTASRLTWSFARDNALLGSHWISQIHHTFGVPIVALASNAIPMLVIGCVQLGSTAAFNAFIGSGLLLQQLTYAMPAALLMCQSRSSAVLPSDRSFKMGGVLGWAANLATVAFTILVWIFYDFPVTLPVTASSMNYTIAVIGGMALTALVNWMVFAKTFYEGPSKEH